MRIIGIVVVALVALNLQAQTFPAKPIRLLVPVAPGDGGGNVAMQELARAEPDGYTLIIGHLGTLAVNPFIFENLPFDTNRDFAAVSLLAKVPNIFVVHADVPARNLREFIAREQARWGDVIRKAGIKAN